MKGFCIAALILFVIIGCVSNHYSGKQIDSKSLATIEKGKTTRWQLLDILGPPASVTLSHDGNKLLQYYYSEIKTNPAVAIPLIGMLYTTPNTKFQSLQVICNQKDIVIDFFYSDRPVEYRTKP